MASHDGVGVGDFVLLDEITVERVVDNLKTRYVYDVCACVRVCVCFHIVKLGCGLPYRELRSRG